jgi:hypothetical protein
MTALLYIISSIIRRTAYYLESTKSFTMLVGVALLLIISLSPIVSQRVNQQVPLQFDVVINHLHQRQRFLPTAVDYESYSITPDKMLALMPRISDSNTTTKCEKDTVLLMEAALRLEKWALKVFDSWGKPIPSGLLKGNVLWVGNYDECVDPLYEPENKTFVSQPFDNQYCKCVEFIV